MRQDLGRRFMVLLETSKYWMWRSLCGKDGGNGEKGNGKWAVLEKREKG